MPGYLNVDVSPQCSPDVIANLEETPWPWQNNSAGAVSFTHSLEHLGADLRVFKSIMQELYRICRHGAEVTIDVPHPRHDDFISDPTHVRPITPELLTLFSKKKNEEWARSGVANSPLAVYWDIDFEIKSLRYTLEPRYHELYHSGQIPVGQLDVMAKEKNNVIKEIQIVIVAVKPG